MQNYLPLKLGNCCFRPKGHKIELVQAIACTFMHGFQKYLAQSFYLKTNILYYTEHTLSNYWFNDPVM